MKLFLTVMLLTIGQLSFAQDLLWAKVLNNTSLVDVFAEETRSIVCDASGNIYITGYFEGTVDFDPGPGVQNLSSAGGSDIFFAKYDASGNYVFAKAMGDIGENDIGYSMVLDNLGNIYITGSFANTVDFDPGPGILNLTSAGINDIFIAKYDASGNYIYAKNFGGSEYDHAYSIVVDGSYNTYITGYFGGTADFDPGAGTQNLTSAGGTDIFFARYDASGNLVYARSIGGISNDIGYSIAVDANSYVCITGHFSFTPDFDPGAGTQILTGTGLTDIFLAKYDASGNYIYAKGMGSTSNNWGNSLALDASGSVFLTGSFDGVVDFDPGISVHNLTSSVGHDIYFAKYDASGNYVYAKSLSGSGFNDLSERIFLDASGNIFLCGTFDGTVDFDPGSGTQDHSSAGGFDIFLAQYDGSGNYIYAKTFGSTGIDIGWAAATDVSGNTYLTGPIEGTVDFDVTTQLTAVNSIDIFIAKFGPLSPLPVKLTSFKGENKGTINKLSWTTATEINNSGFELQRSSDGVNFHKIAFVDSKGRSGNSNTDLSYSIEDINPFPGNNYYRLKQIDINGRFEYSKVILLKQAKPNVIIVKNIFPNPAFENVNITINSSIKESISIVVTNIEGKIVMRVETQLTRGDNQISLLSGSLTAGVYLIQITSPESYESSIHKFIRL